MAVEKVLTAVTLVLLVTSAQSSAPIKLNFNYALQNSSSRAMTTVTRQSTRSKFAEDPETENFSSDSNRLSLWFFQCRCSAIGRGASPRVTAALRAMPRTLDDKFKEEATAGTSIQDFVDQNSDSAKQWHSLRKLCGREALYNADLKLRGEHVLIRPRHGKECRQSRRQRQAHHGWKVQQRFAVCIFRPLLGAGRRQSAGGRHSESSFLACGHQPIDYPRCHGRKR